MLHPIRMPPATRPTPGRLSRLLLALACALPWTGGCVTYLGEELPRRTSQDISALGPTPRPSVTYRTTFAVVGRDAPLTNMALTTDPALIDGIVQAVFQETAYFAATRRGPPAEGYHVDLVFQSWQVHRGLTATSAVFCGLTLFILPAVIEGECALRAVVTRDGERIADYRQSLSTTIWMGLFSLPLLAWDESDILLLERDACRQLTLAFLEAAARDGAWR